MHQPYPLAILGLAIDQDHSIPISGVLYLFPSATKTSPTGMYERKKKVNGPASELKLQPMDHTLHVTLSSDAVSLTAVKYIARKQQRG